MTDLANDSIEFEVFPSLPGNLYAFRLKDVKCLASEKENEK